MTRARARASPTPSRTLWGRRGRERDAAPSHRGRHRRGRLRAARARQGGAGEGKDPRAELAYDVRGSGAGPAVPPRVPARPRPVGRPGPGAVAARFQVVRFDARGFGGSPAGDGPLTMERIADDAAALLDHLQIAAATVCGLSMGGYAALALRAATMPTRLRGLVLADTRARRPTTDQARRVRAEHGGQGAEGRHARPSWTRSCPSSSAKTSHEQRPQVVARVRDLILGQSPARHHGRAGRPGRARGLGAHPARDPRAHPRRLRGRGRHHSPRTRRPCRRGSRAARWS